MVENHYLSYVEQEFQMSGSYTPTSYSFLSSNIGHKNEKVKVICRDNSGHKNGIHNTDWLALEKVKTTCRCGTMLQVQPGPGGNRDAHASSSH